MVRSRKVQSRAEKGMEMQKRKRRRTHQVRDLFPKTWVEGDADDGEAAAVVAAVAGEEDSP